MKIVNHCVVCNSNNVKRLDGYIHRFVLDRMEGTPINPNALVRCNLLNCNDCDSFHTNVRFSFEEETRFYKGYMKDEYINHRCAYDGEFVRHILKSFGTEDYKTIRRNKVHEILGKSINFSDINSVLDYGGDTGFIIPHALDHARKFLLDVDVRENTNDVKSITTPEESGPIDLIICSHVLEHVSYPNDTLKHIKSFMSPTGYLYMEVPKEPFTEPGVHEHINRFNDKNLKYILEKNGFDILIMEDLKYERYVDSAFYALCKLK